MIKKYIYIILLLLILSGCTSQSINNNELRKSFIELWELGFNHGVECMVKYNDNIICSEILNNFREKLNNSSFKIESPLCHDKLCYYNKFGYLIEERNNND